MHWNFNEVVTRQIFGCIELLTCLLSGQNEGEFIRFMSVCIHTEVCFVRIITVESCLAGKANIIP